MGLNIHRALGSSPSNQVRWLRPVIPTTRRCGQEDQRFKATLLYVMSVMPKLPETFSQRMAWGGRYNIKCLHICLPCAEIIL